MALPGFASCGFDFGTSNSSIGHFVNGQPRLVGIQGGRVSIPTAIFFGFEDSHVHFGQEAVTRYLQGDEGRLMRSLKSVLGSSLINEMTQVNGQRIGFSKIISLFISYVREAAGAPSSVVMGRPVHFVDDNEDADRTAETELRAAAEQAGFSHVEFQYEPIAAALDYEQTVSAEQLAFVIDIGGGTSDFSVARVSPERRGRPDRQSDILGYSGVRIGGTDFDRYLNLNTVMPHLGMHSKLNHKNMELPVWWYHDLATWQRINFMYDPKVAADIRRVRRDAIEQGKLDRLLNIIAARKGHSLLGSVEDAKIALSGSDTTVIRMAGLADIEDVEVTRGRFELAIHDAITRVTTEIQNTLRSASISPGAIDVVFLTGGSSKLPLLRSKVRTIFQSAMIVEGDAFGSVATGLTIDAHTRFGA